MRRVKQEASGVRLTEMELVDGGAQGEDRESKSQGDTEGSEGHGGADDSGN